VGKIEGYQSMMDLPVHQRPREKAKTQGMASLSDIEVLALILRSGSKGANVFTMASCLLKLAQGMSGLPRLTMHQCMKVTGIKEAKALELLAVCEVLKRVQRHHVMEVSVIEHPQVLIDWLTSELLDKTQEHFIVVYLNVQNQIISYRTLFIGTLDRSIIHPREIFKEAVVYSAAKIIVVHNHPSGSLQPSSQDVDVTNSLSEAGKMMGIPLLDHLIITNHGYCSLRQKLIVD
jgi:DNA repair protein RadC